MDFRRVLGQGAYGKIFDRISQGKALGESATKLAGTMVSSSELKDLPTGQQIKIIGEFLGKPLVDAIERVRQIPITEETASLGDVNWDGEIPPLKELGIESVVTKAVLDLESELIEYVVANKMSDENRKALERILNTPIFSNYVGWAMLNALAHIKRVSRELAIFDTGDAPETQEERRELEEYSKRPMVGTGEGFSARFQEANKMWKGILKRENSSWKNLLRKPISAKLQNAIEDIMENNIELTFTSIMKAIQGRNLRTRINEGAIRNYLKAHPKIIIKTLNNGSKTYRLSR